MVIIDVGCGVMPEHYSTPDSVGIDINFVHGKVSVRYPIIADVHKIPIRNGVVDSFIICAILEHLDKPNMCLKELHRITKDGGFGVGNIPIHADTRREVFKRFFKEFPFATFYTIKKLLRWIKYFKIDGLMHKRLMTLEYIERFFQLDKVGVIENLRLNQWFVHKTPLWLLVKLGLLSGGTYVREMGEYEFCVLRKQS